MGTEENDAPPSAANVASLVLTGGALILDATGTGGVFTFISNLAALAANRVENEELRRLLDRTASIEDRVDALEASSTPVRRITGDRLKVLVSSVTTEANNFYEWAGADEVMNYWDLTADEYRKAARELEALGLVRVHANGNHPSGIARTQLEPEAFLRVGPAMLEDVSVGEEFLRVLRTAEGAGGDWVIANDVLKESGVPLPRFDLYVRAGEALDLLEGGGSGTRPYFPYFHLTVTPLGRRVLRGDDPQPGAAGTGLDGRAP